MEKELFSSIDLSVDEYFKFSLPDQREFNSLDGNYSVSLTVLEIKSEYPPTDLLFKITHMIDNGGDVKSLDINMIKYRKKFIYEHGLYIIYLDEIENVPKKIRPISIEMKNARDPKSTAKLFYSINPL